MDDETPARSRLKELLADCAGELPLAIAGEAASGPAAIELLAADPADVVLLDVRMPEMDGIEVAQHLQKLERPPAVVFATAYDAYAIRAFEVHAVDYLLKPIRLARLKEALARALAAPRPEVLSAIARAARTHLSAQERGKIGDGAHDVLRGESELFRRLAGAALDGYLKDAEKAGKVEPLAQSHKQFRHSKRKTAPRVKPK